MRYITGYGCHTLNKSRGIIYSIAYFQTEVVVSSIVINGLFISKSKKKTKVEGYYFPIRELEGNFGKCVISAFFSKLTGFY